MSPALSLDTVCKRYGRREPLALDHFSCQIPSGVISGLIGPNGAGKTTLFSVVAGFLKPDSGHIDILSGGAFDPWRLKGRLGILPQDAQLPGQATSRRFLVYLAQLQGHDSRGAQQAVSRALDEVGLLDRADQRICALSHGMRRRLAIASALLGSPELVILDEPTAGLDPARGKQLRMLLSALRGRCTLVISSHNLDELERLCDHVVFIESGRCVRSGSLAELTQRDLRVAWGLGPGSVPTAELEAALPGHVFLITQTEHGSQLRQDAPVGADLDRSSVTVAAILAQAGIPIRSVRRGVSLEDRYIEGRG